MNSYPAVPQLVALLASHFVRVRTVRRKEVRQMNERIYFGAKGKKGCKGKGGKGMKGY